MFCRKCGKTIPDDSKFCPYCGETVVFEEAQPEVKESEHGYCSQCGNPLPDGKLTGLCEDCLSKAGIETAEYGQCENCGRPLEPDDGALCKDCVAKLIKPYAPKVKGKNLKMPKSITVSLLVLVIGIASMIIASLINITPSTAAGAADDNIDSSVITSSSDAALEEETAPSSNPLSVRQQTILNAFQTVIQGDVEGTIKERLKHPDTAVFDYDMTKLAVKNAVFTCLGNVSYTDAQGKTAKDDFTVSLIATDKVYYPLYVKLGNTVSLDARKGTNSLGVATRSGSLFGKTEGDFIFDKSDGDLILITDDVNSNMSLDEYGRIETGMSYADVTEIIGSYGVQEAHSDISGYTNDIYSWVGNGTVGSNANVTFQNGRVIAKAQIGLQ